MGKFSDTSYKNTVDSLIKATNDKLNNPYYMYSDKKPTKVTYYAQNKEKSTLDDASGLYGAHLGNQSPFWFNKIKNFYLYGIDKITTEYDVTDFGTEANAITGEGIVLPNTINPRHGDFFVIDYIKESVLFKVNAVSTDTLDTGANIYKIEYALELTEAIEKIESRVVKTYTFMINNVGTDFNTLMLEEDITLASKVETLIEQLIVYFNDIFFNKKLQTFIFNYNGYRMYDPYVIEFFIRNKVLNFGDEYVFVSHAMHPDATMSMDYLKTIFYQLENPDTLIKSIQTVAVAPKIKDPNSLFMTRLEDYYHVKYGGATTCPVPYATRFITIDQDIIDHINSGELYDQSDDKCFYNIWIAYFNKTDKNFVTSDMLEFVNKADFMNSMESFYGLAITIYILEQYVYGLMAK